MKSQTRFILFVSAWLTLGGIALAAPDRQPYPRWRGESVTSNHLCPALIRRLAALNINCLRINLNADKEVANSLLAPVESGTDGDILLPYRKNLALVDDVLPLCRAAHIQVILCLYGVIGRKQDVFWKETDGGGYREKIVNTWVALAARYRDEPAIVAYDILNEPAYNAGQGDGWWKEILPQSIAAIRKVDSTVWLVVEPGGWGSSAGFAEMPVIADNRVIYSFHDYTPHAYTHQGLVHMRDPSLPDMRGKLFYPGDAPNFEDQTVTHAWDKAALERTMQPVADFQHAHPGTRVLVGEFGVIRWAPGAALWLRDEIDIFEAHGWDWTFHSLGDWNGWDPTYAADAPLDVVAGAGTDDTDRLHALIRGWNLNATH